MGKKGLEPLTLRLSGTYSYLLSYLPHPNESFRVLVQSVDKGVLFLSYLIIIFDWRVVIPPRDLDPATGLPKKTQPASRLVYSYIKGQIMFLTLLTTSSIVSSLATLLAATVTTPPLFSVFKVCRTSLTFSSNLALFVANSAWTIFSATLRSCLFSIIWLRCLKESLSIYFLSAMALCLPVLNSIESFPNLQASVAISKPIGGPT